jgi:acyl-CoA oxidase
VADIHASSSALKSFCTTLAGDGIEDCRKACGGHGFLQCSGLPELITTYLQNPTVEGDNNMLPQQVMKVLLKLVHAVKINEGLEQYQPCDSSALIPSLSAIIHTSGSERCSAIGPDDMCDLQVLLLAFRHRAARLLVQVATQISSEIKIELTVQDAWNRALVSMARASRAYALYLLLQGFVDGLDNENQSGGLGQAESNVLGDLARLFALFWIEKDTGEFLEDGYLSTKQVNWVRSGVLKYLDVIRPNAIALVDARDFSDFRLKSVLGRYDGNVYPHIMEAAARDPLNQMDPGPAYDPELKRLIGGGVGEYNGTASRL